MNRPTLVLALSLVAVLGGCGGSSGRGSWPQANGDLAAARTAEGAPITARNVAGLRARWRFRLRAKPGSSGIFASTPVADAVNIYLQDLRSNVFALDRTTGALRWTHRYDTANAGPNGLAVDSGRVYGATGGVVFALASRNGRELWQRRLKSDVAPTVWHGLLFTSTVGEIYALDANTGRIRWRFDEGHSYLGSVDGDGRLYAGTKNALLVLGADTGKLRWTDREGFDATPILARVGQANLVFGAGATGRITAWDSSTQKRRWTTLMSAGESGCLGGIERPMAYARTRLFVPVVDRCGGGRLVAVDAKDGTMLWQRALPSPALGCATVANDVVFTATFAGVVYGFSTRNGKLLWETTLRAGVDACPAVVDGLLVVGAGIPKPGGRTEVVVFGLPKAT